MASPDFHLDTRIQRHHVSLITQQHRLHHLRTIVARNITNVQNEALSLHYSLHCSPESNAFYSSEVISGNSNPTWQDLKSSMFTEIANPASSFITVKLWNFSHLIVEWVVFFCGLHYLGKQISKEGKSFENNTLIFGMYEGFYGCKAFEHPLDVTEFASKALIYEDIDALLVSCELSTLGRMKTIERALRQTQVTSYKRRQRIEKKLQTADQLYVVYAQREYYKIKLHLLLEEEKRQNFEFYAIERHINTSQAALKFNQMNFSKKQEELIRLKEKMMESWQKFCYHRETLLKTNSHLTFREKQLIWDLNLIYPMMEFPDCKGYSIQNVYLPNSENLYGHDDTMIGIALGYVCHFVLMVAQFLNIPLRYQMQFHGSCSTITDQISTVIPMKIKEFPLFLKGKDRRLFEYAVYLLNKNIAQVRIACGLVTKDLTATLPNLSSLIKLRLSYINDNLPTLLGRGGGTADNNHRNGSQQGFIKLNDSFVSSVEHNDVTHELEYLEREMAELTPDPTSCMLPSWSNEMCKEQSCSLDKGLNDIQVLENSISLGIQDIPVRNSHNLKLRKTIQDIHHSSYPNLNLCFHLDDGTFFTSQNKEFQTSFLKVWKTESSQGNSEEEMFDENGEIIACSNLELKNSCFCIISHENNEMM